MQEIEQQCRDFILSCGSADLSYDITHIERVVQVAKTAEQEHAKIEVVLLGGLTIVLRWRKPSGQSEGIDHGSRQGVKLLHSIHYDSRYFDAIHHAIVAHICANVTPTTLERNSTRCRPYGCPYRSESLHEVAGRFVVAIPPPGSVL